MVEQDADIKKRIEEKERELTEKRTDIQNLSRKIQEDKKKTGSTPRADQNRLNLFSRQESDIQNELNILRTSTTAQEVGVRASALKTQLAQRQAAQSPKGRESQRLYQETVREAKELTGVTNIANLPPRTRDSIIRKSLIEKYPVEEKILYEDINGVRVKRGDVGEITSLSFVDKSPVKEFKEGKIIVSDFSAFDTGSIAFKPEELKERGITLEKTEGGKISRSQSQLAFAELAVGLGVGESGVAVLSKSDLSLKKYGVIAAGTAAYKGLLPTPKEFQTQALSRLNAEERAIFEEAAGVDFDAGLSQTRGMGFKSEIVNIVTDNPEVLFPPLLIGTGAGLGLRGLGKGLTKFAPKLLPYAEGIAATIGITLGGVVIGKTLQRTETLPEFEQGQLIGLTTAEFAAFGAGFKAGFKTVDFAGDIIRTRGLKELPIVEGNIKPFVRNDIEVFYERNPLGQFKQRKYDVIAPEYRLQGQRYPAIQRGQSQGQLRTEFFEPILPGETVGEARGFTATSKAFKDVDIVPMGDSYIPGRFSAPKVSPVFLRISNDYGFNIFETSGLLGTEPTAARFAFGDISFARGGSRQTRLNPIDANLRKYFQDIGGTGKTAIPFAKTEKEAVTAFDSLINTKQTRFYFKFNGRRVVIPEIDILPSGSKLSNVKLKDYIKTESLSNRGIASYSARAATDFGLGGISSIRTSKFLTSSYKSLSSFKSSSKKISSSIVTSYKYPSSSFSSSFSYNPISSGGGSSIRRSYSYYPSKPTSYPPAFAFGGGGVIQTSRAGKRKFKRTPSLASAIKFDITGFGGGKVSTGLEETGLFEKGFGKKIPKIKLGNLIGDVRVL